MFCILPTASTSRPFCKQRWRKWSGHWTRVFCIANTAQRLISGDTVLDHADPGYSYCSDIYFSEVLRPQSRNLPPTCLHCFCYIYAHPFGMVAGAVLTTFLRALRTVYVLQGQNLILGAKNCICLVQSVFQGYG